MSLVFNGEDVCLPGRVGSIQVVGRKMTPKIKSDGTIGGAGPDWVKTKELWDRNPEAKAERRIVVHLNEHTNGLRYKITWHKRRVNMENQKLYSLIFSRTNKRDVHKMILSGKEYYIKN